MVVVLANRVDELLAPYAAKNYEKHLAGTPKFGLKESGRQEAYAMKKTEKEHACDAILRIAVNQHALYIARQTPLPHLDLDHGTEITLERYSKRPSCKYEGIGKEKRILPKLFSH